MNNEKFRELITKLKNGRLLFIIGIAGIALICLSTFLPGKSTKKASDTTGISSEEYCAALEKKLTGMVTAITGSSDVTVVITLDSGIKYTYADETKQNATEKTGSAGTDKSDELQSSYITVKLADGSESALLITEYMPQIRGVTVVCAGLSGSKKQDIENAVTATLGVTSRRVCVVSKDGA